MERRDWSLKALRELIYIDSLDVDKKTIALFSWAKSYLEERSIENFDLESRDLKKLEELFFKNIKFLKDDKINTLQKLKDIEKLKKFLNH